MSSLPQWAIIAGIALAVIVAAAWLIARRRRKADGDDYVALPRPAGRKNDLRRWRSRRLADEAREEEWPWPAGVPDEGGAEPAARPAPDWGGDPGFAGDGAEGGEGGGRPASPPPASQERDPDHGEDDYRDRHRPSRQWRRAFLPEPRPAPEREQRSASRRPSPAFLPPPPSSPLPSAPEPGPGAGPPDLPAPEANEYRVWFGTNRMPVDPADPKRGFSGLRDPITRYGHCDVLVPESHKIGSIGSSWLRRLVTLTDDRLRLRQLAVLEREAYWQALGRQLAEKAAGERHAVVFIHGYNVGFEDAAIRAAQIGFDLGIDGAMAFFSWPSRGKTGQYLADGAAIEASEAAIADFLADFGRKTGADFVHVIAHSMGNRGLLRAINRIFADAERRSGCNFGEFILAAPDVDADTFGQLAAAYHQMAMRTTLYVSGRDRAVELAKWIHDYPRVGFEPPISIFDNIDTVSVTNVDLTLLGHGYVAEARPVLSDIHAILFHGDPPEKRPFLRERSAADGRRYWEVRG